MSGADRNRRYRERKAAGLRVLRCGVAIDNETIRRLVDLGTLPYWVTESDADLSDWISHHLDELAERDAVTGSLKTA
jgi:hypothetical protein